MKTIITFFCAGTLFLSCGPNNTLSDAYGNFETVEISVAAEGNGKIIDLNVEEGSNLNKGQLVGAIDTSQLHYQKKVLRAKRSAIASKIGHISAQRDVFEEQLKKLNAEIDRFKLLVADKAAPQKQLDDLEAEALIAKSKIKSIETQNIPVFSEIKVIDAQIEQLNDVIIKSKIINPIAGTVTSKLAEQGEMIGMVKTIYRIAKMDNMILRVYVSGEQLSHIKLNQSVEVLIDNDAETNSSLTGTITWISEKAEFTPKIIQTKEERVNLVYAVKVIVANDGSLKMGMPGEVNFSEIVQ
jgi:HlyD family secretion protein